MSFVFVNLVNVKCKVWKVEINIVFYEIYYLCRKWEKNLFKKIESCLRIIIIIECRDKNLLVSKGIVVNFN